MPFYDYICNECDQITTVLQKRGEASPACKNCGAGQLIKQIGSCRINLTGSGWYKDGYSIKSDSDAKSQDKTDKS